MSNVTYQLTEGLGGQAVFQIYNKVPRLHSRRGGAAWQLQMMESGRVQRCEKYYLGKGVEYRITILNNPQVRPATSPRSRIMPVLKYGFLLLILLAYGYWVVFYSMGHRKVNMEYLGRYVLLMLPIAPLHVVVQRYLNDYGYGSSIMMWMLFQMTFKLIEAYTTILSENVIEDSITKVLRQP